MTVNSILTKVRRLLQDTESPYHWTDDKIIEDLNMAVVSLHKIRPETRYVDGRLVDRVEIPSDRSVSIAIDVRFEDCLVYYTAYLSYADDCTDPVSKALADDFLGKFTLFANA